MNEWLQRWLALAPREQWLVYGGGLALAGMLYLLLLGDPLANRLRQVQAAQALAEARQLEAEAGLAGLQAKLASDPSIAYRSALLMASTTREELIRQIDENTAALLTPAKMKAVLEQLLQAQPRLQLVQVESFSEPVQLPGVDAASGEAGEQPAIAPVTLYRHGLRLQLQGGYFDLLGYLQAIQGSGWTLNWDSLDYQVGESGPAQARISLKLHTLSRQAGWVGV